MGIATKIQWCDSTCNPTMGCDGCELWNLKAGEQTCYAGVLHRRYGGLDRGFSPTFDEVTLWPERMAGAASWSDLKGVRRDNKPWLGTVPRLIFVSDMSDALSKAVSFEYLRREIVQVAMSPKGQRHCWLWLTKRPDRMAQFSKFLSEHHVDWPSNLWVGTSVTTQVTASRIHHLKNVGNEATIRFVSVEPQRERINLRKHLSSVDWVIQGGESGPSAHCFQIQWAKEMIDQCVSANVAYFLKQLGSRVMSGAVSQKFVDGHAGDWNEWPDEIRVRNLPRRALVHSSQTTAEDRSVRTPEVRVRERILGRK